MRTDAWTLKADAIRVKVGYPLSPNTESARSIALYYNLVIVDKKKFAENVLSSWYAFTGFLFLDKIANVLIFVFFLHQDQ